MSYIFDEADTAIVRVTRQLIAKVVGLRSLSESKRSVVLAIAKSFNNLPRVTCGLKASFTLVGPRRRFDDREINHYWRVEVEDDRLEVTAGGYFHRPSTGGDSFTSFCWEAYPDCGTEKCDYSASLPMVDDAKPFDREIGQLDLDEAGYSLSVLLDGEDIGDDEDAEAGEEPEIDGSSRANEELVVCLWAFLDSGLRLIYALAGRVYCLTGDDESKLQTLRELSRFDFRSVGRLPVPKRFVLSFPDGSERRGFVPPQAVFDPNATLFEDLIKELERQMPPISDFVRNTAIRQVLPDDPLGVRTIVFEDGRGNCRAIVDEEDKAWLLERLS